ncbi:uncharacterized protein BX663DRAFT_488123 [Cokeromyces recurvatus]|uniref:uncharacterized protein n=1 Tax=Cokeromyces recurvatus TaxID=90255 RepID=UPI00221E550D|nr:uncharacterized protein BX663DRAFT_488123 [Cokeromyces recurvatus]KAI7900809.1 hypothetical protein BX663DRAFT_488123 [Cokeromyces recurvatus]
MFVKTETKLISSPKYTLSVNYARKVVLIMLTFSDHKVVTSDKKRGNKAAISNEIKKLKKRRRITTITNSMDKCKNCDKTERKSARLPNCENHILSKQEVFHKNLGQRYQTFARKLPLDKCVTIQHLNNLKS